MKYYQVQPLTGLEANLPYDESGFYCAVCANFLGKTAHYLECGTPNDGILCNDCFTEYGHDDVPPTIDGVRISYEQNIINRRRSWLQREGYGDSSRERLRSTLGIDCVENGEPHHWVMYWTKHMNFGPIQFADQDLWYKLMINTQTGRHVAKFASDTKAGKLYSCGHYNKAQYDKVLNQIQTSPDLYLDSPPEGVLWK